MPPRVLALLVALVIAAVATWSAAAHPFDDDEFQHLHIAWAMWHGHLPYVEVFEHHLVAAHALLAPLVGPAQGVWTLFVIRALGVLCLLATLGLWARIAWRSGCRLPLVAGAALLVGCVPMLVLKMTEVRPAVPATLLHALAAWWLIAAAPRTWWRSALLAGVLAGAMILCSQKYLYAAVGLWAAAWLLHGLRHALLMAAVAAACGGGYLAVMAVLGALAPMWDSVVVMNLHWKRSFSPRPYLVAGYRSAPLLLALAVLGAVDRRLDRRRLAVLLILAAAVLQLAMVPVPFRQTFLPLFGPLLVLAAIALHRLSVRVPQWVLALVVVAGCLPGLASLVEEIAPGHAEDRARMARVEALAAPGMPVFDGRGLLYWRPHVGHHACMHEGIQLMLDEEAYAAETVAALVAAGLPPVLRDYRVKAMPLPIRDLLVERYLSHPEDPQLLVPGLQVPRSRLRRRATIELPVAGQWAVDWSGGGLRIDGVAVESGRVLPLAAGEHRLEAAGFVKDLVFRLERWTDER